MLEMVRLKYQVDAEVSFAVYFYVNYSLVVEVRRTYLYSPRAVKWNSVGRYYISRLLSVS